MWTLGLILLCTVLLDFIKIDMFNGKSYTVRHVSCSADVKEKEQVEKKVLDLGEQGARM